MEERRIDLDELAMIRELRMHSEWIGSEQISQKDLARRNARVKEILEYFSDVACSHHWQQLGESLKRCIICKTTRITK